MVKKKKKAYEKIIAKRDSEARDKFMWAISVGLLMVLVALFPSLI